MSKRISIAKVNEDLSLDHQNRAVVHDFLYKNRGKTIRVVLEEHKGEISNEKRGYFEGALLKSFHHFQNKERVEIGYPPYAVSEMREILKKEFNGTMIVNSKGQSEKLGRSTNSMSNARFGKFIDKIVCYMEENGIPVPDPQEYKTWRDSAPDVGARYFQDVWLPLNDPDYIKI